MARSIKEKIIIAKTIHIIIMYCGSIDRAVTAKLITISDIATEIKNKISPEDEIYRTFMTRRKLVAFKYICNVNPKLALQISNTVDRSLYRTIWLLITTDSVFIEFEDSSTVNTIAKVITGCCDKIETEQLSYYIEAGNDLTDIRPNLMILETCVDVDRIIDLLRYLPIINTSQTKIVLIRMITRFCKMKDDHPLYFQKCIYDDYLDFFRRFIVKPEMLSYSMIQLIQSATDDKFLDMTLENKYQLLSYRCNARTITRILGIDIGSSISDIELAVSSLKELGIDEYYRQLHHKFDEQLKGLDIRNTTDLHFANFYEYHPDDIILSVGYMFTGPEYNNLLSTRINPYTRQPLPDTILKQIRLTIPQPSETMKELCQKYLM